ncbi:alcohol-forming fatty acyl-CoA reductase [Sarracenia purpurea var. burkii]
MVANATLAAIAKHGAVGKAGSNVYQIASSVVNPLLIQDLTSFMYHHFKSTPCINSKGQPIEVSALKLVSSMENFSSHLLERWRIEEVGCGCYGNPSKWEVDPKT